MFCVSCGTLRQNDAARFCGSCGREFPEASITAPDAPPPSEPVLPLSPTDPAVLERQRSAKRLTTSRCLLCGFEGEMPVTYVPWVGTWPGLLLTVALIAGPIMLLAGGGFLVGLAAGGVVGFLVQWYANRHIRYQCPSCLNNLEPV